MQQDLPDLISCDLFNQILKEILSILKIVIILNVNTFACLFSVSLLVLNKKHRLFVNDSWLGPVNH